MTISFIEKQNNYSKIFIFSIYYLVFLLAFLINENSSGGALQDYQGYILMQVDRKNLNEPPFSLTGTLMREHRDDNSKCKFTGNYTKIFQHKTFSGIEKHRQIKYIGGKEYYFSGEEYGAIYLQGDVDSRGENLGYRLRKEREQILKEASLAKFHEPIDWKDYGKGWIVTNRKWARGKVLLMQD